MNSPEIRWHPHRGKKPFSHRWQPALLYNWEFCEPNLYYIWVKACLTIMSKDITHENSRESKREWNLWLQNLFTVKIPSPRVNNRQCTRLQHVDTPLISSFLHFRVKSNARLPYVTDVNLFRLPPIYFGLHCSSDPATWGLSQILEL